MATSHRQSRLGSEVGCKDLAIYERLALLNRHCTAIAEILKLLADESSLPKRESRYFQLMVEEVRASSSQTILERLDEREVRATAIASKRRLLLEKKLFGC